MGTRLDSLFIGTLKTLAYCVVIAGVVGASAEVDYAPLSIEFISAAVVQ